MQDTTAVSAAGPAGELQPILRAALAWLRPDQVGAFPRRVGTDHVAAIHRIAILVEERD